VQSPSLRREGWHFRPRLDLLFRDPGMRRMALLMGPATVGLAATQVNIAVNSSFASQEPGAVAWLNYAFRLMQLPLGLFGVAVGTIATAQLARRAAERDADGMRRTLVQALRLVAFLTIPATVGLVALAEPVIRLIFQHGRFRGGDTEATAKALLFYALGLFAYSAVKVIAPAFYSVGRARVPLAASVSAVLANLLFNVTLYPVLGYRGLALGTSIAASINFLVLAGMFQRGYGGLTDRALWSGVGAMTVAALPMGLVAWGSAWGLERALGPNGFATRLVEAAVPIVAGMAVYAGLCRLFGLAEVGELTSFVRRKRAAR
jgi:putative peptidoglycan lipid II flippase